MRSFVPHHFVLTAPDTIPQRYLLVLHGVFGSGKNWRLFMRKLVARCPQWGAVLVDVRGHGDSLGAAGPHNIEAVADDLIAVERKLPAPVRGICGHSLGGKLALGYAARRRDTFQQLWVLDSRPGKLDPQNAESTQKVLRLLTGLPPSFASRDGFIEALIRGGQSKAVSQWLAMNLCREGESFRLGLELDVVGALLESYYTSDWWPELARTAPQRALHQVVGSRGVWDSASLERLDELAQQRATTMVHRLNAGHWLHVDAPDALLDLMTHALNNS